MTKKIPKEQTTQSSKSEFSGARFRPQEGVRVAEVRISKRFDEYTMRETSRGVRVATAYKRKAQKIQPVDWSISDGSKSGGRQDWKAREVDRERRLGLDQPRGEFDRLLIPKFSTMRRGSRLIEERREAMRIGEELLPREKELLLAMLYNREAALSWNFSEIGKIKPEVSPPLPIRTVPHKAWQAPGFPIPRALTKNVIEMLQERLEAGMLEQCHGPYRNPWFLVKKKSGKYRLVNAAMNINQVTIRDANMPPAVDEFAEEFAGMTITSLIDFFSGYDQIALDEKSRDLTAFMTPLGLLRQTTLPQGATNSVAQFVRVVTKILENHIPTKWVRPISNPRSKRSQRNLCALRIRRIDSQRHSTWKSVKELCS